MFSLEGLKVLVIMLCLFHDFFKWLRCKSKAICCLLNFWFYLMQRFSHGSTSILQKANIFC